MPEKQRYAALLLPMLVLVGIAYLVPLVGVLVISVTEPEVGLDNYRRLVDSPAIGHILLTTMRVCGLTTFVSVLIGYLLAYALIRSTGLNRRLMLFCIVVPLWTSVLIRTFAWLLILGDQGPLNSALQWAGLIDRPLAFMRNELGVVIGMVHYMTPYAAFTILAGMSGIDERLVMAARGLGSNAAGAFFRVYLPLTLPGVFGAAVLVLVLSLGFFITPIILGGGRVVMIGEYISMQILQIARWGVGAMLATVLLAAALVIFAAAAKAIDMRRLFSTN